jgi:hypothetical protein
MSIPINFSYERSGNVELFDYYASANVANGITASIVNQRVPSSFKRGFITVYGHGIDDPSAFLTSIFRIRVNGVADRYYQSIQDQLAPFGEPREIAPILIRPNDLIELDVTNNGAVSRLYATRIRGFFDYAWSEKS